MSKDFELKMTGDWNKAGLYFQNLAVKLYPAFEAKIWEDGQFVLERMRGHIDNQDLDWIPITTKTIELKGGDDTIYQTGTERHCGEGGQLSTKKQQMVFLTMNLEIKKKFLKNINIS